jgi:hypothetical protein
VPAEVINGAGDTNVEDQILEQLEAIAAELPKEDQGGTRIIVGGRHFSLGEAGWKLLTSSAAFAISTLDPTHLTKLVALNEGLGLLKELRPLLQKLDPGKMLVCSAIARVSAMKKRSKKFFQEPGASRADIENYFEQGGETVENLDAFRSILRDQILR